jgi:hypothetical protein
MTPPSDTPISLTALLMRLWDDTRVHHPDLPPATVTVSSSRTSSDHSTGRWKEEGVSVTIGRDVLEAGALATLTHLMHMAAHALNLVEGVEDTKASRGFYHNRQFLPAAERVGLVWPETPPTRAGFRDVAFSRRALDFPQTKAALQELDEAITATLPSLTARRETSRTDARVKAACSCGRTMRIGATVLSAGPIVCGNCQTPFQLVP